MADVQATGDSYKLERSLPLLAEIGSKSRNAVALLSALVTDQKFSLQNRLKAVLPLAKSGSNKGAAELLIRTAMTHVADQSNANANAYAIEHLQDVLSDDALPLPE